MAALTQGLSGPQFEQMLADLRALSADPTLEQIRDVMIRYGIRSPQAKDGLPSNMAARTLKLGPFKRYIERIEAGREAREQLCTAAGAGAKPIDAMEEMVAVELQDHFTAGGPIDIEWVTKQMLKLRTSISMGEESRRKQQDLERKIADSEAARVQNEQRTAILEKRLELVQLDAAQAAIEHAKEIRGVLADTKLDGAAKTERVRQILFGQKPADFKPVTDKGEQAE